MIAAIVTTLLIAAAGLPFARSKAAEAYLLGAGIATGVLFAMSLLHIPWSRAALLAVLIAFAALNVVKRVRLSRPHPNPIDAITAIFVIGYARYATIGPSPETDFLKFWGLKAKQFAFAGGIDWTFLQNPFNQFAHVDYPPLVALLFDAHTLIAGEWPGRWLGVVNVAFGIATLLLLRDFVNDETENRWLRAIATLALLSSAFSPWLGLAEGPLVAYGTAGLLFIRRGEIGRGAVYLGLAANCKNEGLTLIAAAAVALMVAGAWRSVVRLWPAVAVAAPWLIARSAHGLHGDLATPGAAARIVAHLHNPGPIFDAMAQYSLGKPLLWSGVVVALIVAAPRIARRERFLAVAIVVQLLFFIGAYVVTPHDVTWHVRWSWERIVTQLAAAIVFLALAGLMDVLREKARGTAVETPVA